MSIIAVDRSVRLLSHLKMHGTARFKDLAALFGPISHTALSLLLRSLVETGQIVRVGRNYQLASDSVVLGGTGRSIYQLPPVLREQADAILMATARELNHSCALFARVGVSTMKIVAEHNLPGTLIHFTPLGYEWPLMPFHGFAQVFLAHEATEVLARDCYYRWRPYLQTHLQAASYKQFRTRLARIRKQGYAVEYKEESGTLMRMVLPVPVPPEPGLRFAVGIVAQPVYLLDVDRCVPRLRQAAEELARLLTNRVPIFLFDEHLPNRSDTD